MSERSSQFPHYAQAIHVSQIRLQLAKFLMLLLRAFAVGHIDVRTDHLAFSVRGEQRMAGGFEIFDCPVRKKDSELDHVGSILTQRLKSRISYPFAFFWMYPLQHGFEVGKTMQRIKTPDSITFFRPVDRPCLA